MNLLINNKNLHSKMNILTYIEMIKQTVKNCKIINLFIIKSTLTQIRVIIFSIHTFIIV